MDTASSFGSLGKQTETETWVQPARRTTQSGSRTFRMGCAKSHVGVEFRTAVHQQSYAEMGN